MYNGIAHTFENQLSSTEDRVYRRLGLQKTESTGDVAQYKEVRALEIIERMFINRENVLKSYLKTSKYQDT